MAMAAALNAPHLPSAPRTAAGRHRAWRPLEPLARHVLGAGQTVDRAADGIHSDNDFDRDEQPPRRRRRRRERRPMCCRDHVPVHLGTTIARARRLKNRGEPTTESVVTADWSERIGGPSRTVGLTLLEDPRRVSSATQDVAPTSPLQTSARTLVSHGQRRRFQSSGPHRRARDVSYWSRAVPGIRRL